MPEVRPIDRQALIKDMCNNKTDAKCLCYPNCYPCDFSEARRIADIQPTIEAEPVRQGRWNDDCTEVVCSICKSEFSYEMLIFIARGIKSEHVDGMTCRCPKCGSYNIYGGDENG